MGQYEKFLSFENFKLAFARIVRSPRNEYKEFYDKDIKAFEYRFEDNIKQLMNEIEEELYEPQMAERYYIPKSSGFVRPITLLNFLDCLVYQSLANIVADVVHEKVHDYFNVNTFGNIFKKTMIVHLNFSLNLGKSSGNVLMIHLRKHIVMDIHIVSSLIWRPFLI